MKEQEKILITHEFRNEIENYTSEKNKFKLCPLIEEDNDFISILNKKELYKEYNNMIKTSYLKVLNMRNIYNEFLKLNRDQMLASYRHSIEVLYPKYSYTELFNMTCEYFDVDATKLLKVMKKSEKETLISFLKKSYKK